MQKKSLDQKDHIRVDREDDKLVNYKNNSKNFFRSNNLILCTVLFRKNWEQFLTVEKWFLLEDHSSDDSEIY